MNEMSPLQLVLSIFIAVVSGACSAFLIHFLNRKRNREENLRSAQIRAYTDYVGTASRMALAKRRKDEESYSKELVQYNDSKARICMCAPSDVIRAMIEFHKSGANLEEEFSIMNFDRLCREIRRTLGADSTGLLHTSQVLFDLVPGALGYQYRTEWGFGPED
jgi:hypothetical protein